MKRIVFLATVFLSLFGFFTLVYQADIVNAQAKPLRIGVTLPLNVSMGLEAKKCFDVLVPDFNAKGGMTIDGIKYQIEMIIYDDGMRADKGRAAMERLVHNDKVRFVVGQLASAPTVAALSVTEPEKVIVFTGAASNKLLEAENHYTVRTSNLSTAMPGQRAYMLKKYPHIKTQVYVGPDDDTGYDVNKQDDRICEKLGIKKLGSNFIPRDTRDFTSIALKITNLNPDLVYSSGLNQGVETGSLLKALYQAGYKGIKLGVPPDMDVIKGLASKETMEGYLAVFRDGSETPTPMAPAKHLRELYTAKYGSWNDTRVMWVGAWYAFLEVMKKANSFDPDKIMAAMEKLEFDTPQGHFILVKRPDMGVKRYCDTVADIHMGMIRNSKFEYVDTLQTQEGVAVCEKVYGGGNWR